MKTRLAFIVALFVVVSVPLTANASDRHHHHGHHSSHFGSHSLFHFGGHHYGSHHYGHHSYGHHSYGHHGLGLNRFFGSRSYRYSQPSTYYVPSYSYRPAYRVYTQQPTCAVIPAPVQPRVVVPPAKSDDRNPPAPQAVPQDSGTTNRRNSPIIRSAVFTVGNTSSALRTPVPGRRAVTFDSRLGPQLSQSGRPNILHDTSSPWIVAEEDDTSVGSHVAELPRPSDQQRSDRQPPAPRAVEPEERRLVIPASMRGIAQLPARDRAAALRQRTCPVTGDLLGADGRPLKVSIGGRAVFVCCDGCKDELRANPREFIAGKSNRNRE